MTKIERLKFKKELSEKLKEIRTENIRYEQVAVETGISLDTLRRIMYDSKNIPSEITIKKILKWLEKYKKNHKEALKNENIYSNSEIF